MLNEELLYEMYVEKKCTILTIALQAGVSYTAVRNGLLKFGIKIRDSHTSKRLAAGYPPELECEEWIYDKYVVQKLSLNQIAKQLNTDYNKVKSCLTRFGINTRTKSDGQKLIWKSKGVEDYFVFNRPVIEGCLLGDGGLRCEALAAFRHTSMHYDRAQMVAEQLFSSNGVSRIKQRKPSNSFGGNSSIIFDTITLTHKELVDLYNIWYPEKNGYKKVIPASLEIDNIVLLNWFLDDGYSYRVHRNIGKYSYDYVRVQFATQSFCKDDLDILCDKIENKFGLIMKPRYHQRHGIVEGTGYFVELSNRKEQVAEFYKIVGPCPVPSLAYKWKIPT